MKTVLNLAALAAVALAVATPAAAIDPVGYQLNNSNGGDGFVVDISALRFDLYGSNDDIDDNMTTYSQVATADGIISGKFRYFTRDAENSRFDPAGYFVNGNFVQLSDDDLPQYSQNFGNFSFNVSNGDTYGFYVLSTDGFGGRGSLTVGAIPEPSSWAMMIAGFGLVGATLRRRRAVAA